MSGMTMESVWLTADEQDSYSQALQNLPQATIYSGACFWLMYRIAEFQGRRLGAVRGKLWQINSLNLIYALTAIYSGYLFHFASGESARTMGRKFVFSPVHVAVVPWLLGFLVVEYLIVKNKVEGLDEGERIAKLFRCSIGPTFVILQQVYPSVVGMHWLHWMQLCEARLLFSSANWMLAAKTFPDSIRNPLHAVHRVVAFLSLVGTVAASAWAGNVLYENQAWYVPGLPSGKHRLTMLHVALMACGSVLLSLTAWSDYQALKDGPVVLPPIDPLTEEELAPKKLAAREQVEDEGEEEPKPKSNIVTTRKTKGQRKYM